MEQGVVVEVVVVVVDTHSFQWVVVAYAECERWMEFHSDPQNGQGV
jgi:hypothetical protein